jgi:rRNA maturation endonuclease Nob1
MFAFFRQNKTKMSSLENKICIECRRLGPIVYRGDFCEECQGEKIVTGVCEHTLSPWTTLQPLRVQNVDFYYRYRCHGCRHIVKFEKNSPEGSIDRGWTGSVEINLDIKIPAHIQK